MTTKPITIATIDGPQTVNATVINGLAYHHCCVDLDVFSEDEWTVTHVESGRSAMPGNVTLLSKKACERYIAEIQPLADWSLDADELWRLHGPNEAPNSAMRDALRRAYDKATNEVRNA